ILRLRENTRSLLMYAGWARRGAPDEFPLAASAARSAAGRALDFAAREMIAVFGGIGATWEHDAPLYFRRAPLSRRLLGGTRAGGGPRAGGRPRAAARPRRSSATPAAPRPMRRARASRGRQRDRRRRGRSVGGVHRGDHRRVEAAVDAEAVLGPGDGPRQHL